MVASCDRTRCPHRGWHHRRWYYTALRQPDDPVGSLRRAVRKDCGKISLASALAERLHPSTAITRTGAINCTMTTSPRLEGRSSLGRLPSYSTVKRYMQAHGLVRRPRLRPSNRPGEARAEARRQAREIRSYEADPRRSRSGISTSTTDRSRCSLPAASGCGRLRWASLMTTRDCAATSSGISRRPPRIWSMGSPRRSRNGACRGRC